MVELREDERFADWVDGRMTDRERERFEAELAADPQLAKAADDYRRWTLSVREALRVEDEPGPDLTDRTLALVLRDSAPRRPRFVPWLGSFAAAAALVLVYLGIRSLPGESPLRTPTARAPQHELADAVTPAPGAADARDGVVLREVEERLERPGTEGANVRKVEPPESRRGEAPGSAVGQAKSSDDFYRRDAIELKRAQDDAAPMPPAGSAAPPGDAAAAPVPDPATGTELYAGARIAERDIPFGAAAGGESVAVVVFELPEPTPEAGAAGRRVAAKDQDTAAEESDLGRMLGLTEGAVVAYTRVLATAEQDRAAAALPELRVARLMDGERAEERGRDSGLAPMAPGAYVAGPADQVFELRGDAAGVGDLLRMLTAAATERGGSVKNEWLPRERADAWRIAPTDSSVLATGGFVAGGEEAKEKERSGLESELRGKLETEAKPEAQRAAEAKPEAKLPAGAQPEGRAQPSAAPEQTRAKTVVPGPKPDAPASPELQTATPAQRVLVVLRKKGAVTR